MMATLELGASFEEICEVVNTNPEEALRVLQDGMLALEDPEGFASLYDTAKWNIAEKEIFQKMTLLSEKERLLFTVDCVEHILPLYETALEKSLLKEALEMLKRVPEGPIPDAAYQSMRTQLKELRSSITPKSNTAGKTSYSPQISIASSMLTMTIDMLEKSHSPAFANVLKKVLKNTCFVVGKAKDSRAALVRERQAQVELIQRYFTKETRK